jgi:hypothetical protein
MKHKHHIIPRYKGGSNLKENLVELTPIQHAMWHFAEWQRKQDYRDYLAWKCLSGQIEKEEIQYLKSKIGGLNTPNTPEIQQKKRQAMLGRKQTEEHKNKRSKALKGRVCCSPEAIERMRQTKRKLTEDQVREIRNSTEKGIVLASKYRITPSLVSQIRLNKSLAYNHII